MSLHPAMHPWILGHALAAALQRRRLRRTVTFCATLLGLQLMASAAALSQRPLVVMTSSGPVRGVAGDLLAFLGIPYAAPPVGPLRWRPPEPHPGWTEPLDATAYGPDCIQSGFAQQFGAQRPRPSEDCLTLNIWTAGVANGAQYPVMVWLHGSRFGATRRDESAWLFADGSGTDPITNGRRLAGYGAVVVTINYRVGFLGYLASESLSAESPDGASGNYALHDQIAALRWVQENIAGFGGDPARVTLFGHGAGARLASLLMTSPSAEGLFHQVILQSPGPMTPLERLDTVESRSASFEPTSLRDVWTVENIRRHDYRLASLRFAPIVDGHLVPVDDVRAFAEGRFHAVPLMIGTVMDEGSLYSDVASANALVRLRQWRERTFRDVPDPLPDILPGPAASASESTATALMQIYGDAYVTHGVRRIARASAERQPQTFRYAFTRRAVATGGPPRHSDEVAYVFGNLREMTLFSAMAALRDGLPRRATGDPTDEALSESIMAAWVRFAATGNPNGGDLPVWPNYALADEAMLIFGDTIRIGREERARELDAMERAFRSLQERESGRMPR